MTHEEEVLSTRACTDFFLIRRIEEELGSWPYLVASAHLVILSEVLEKMIMHVLLKTGRVA